MKILILTTSFPVSPGSSSGIFVERLARHLARHPDTQNEVVVLAPMSKVPAQNNEQSCELITFRYAPVKMQFLAHGGGGIPAALAKYPYAVLLVPVFILSMLMHCLWYGRKVDVIFANWSVCGLVAGIAGKIIRKPVVTTIRGEDANRIEFSKIYRLILWLCLRLSKKVVTVSDDMAAGLVRRFAVMKQKIMTIPNGVEIVSSIHRERPKNGSKEIRLIMVGSLIPRKDVATALKALHLLPSEFVLTIIGHGAEFEQLCSLTRELKLQERVVFKGHVKPEEIVNHLLESDLFILTSKSEGRPNALLEAAACGLPAVGSDIPGVREIIVPDVSGVLFPVGDYRTLAQNIRPFADRSLRDQFGQEGQRLIKERGLTWDNTAGLYLEEFRKFCS